MSKRKILFVCLGNICRSPLAEGIAKSITDEKNLNLTIFSSGVSASHERERPCADSIKIARLHDIDISQQRARQIRSSDKELFDCIIAMDEEVRIMLEDMGFINVRLLGEFAHFKGTSVPDPYFFDTYDERIEEVYTMISLCVHDLLQRINDGSL